MKIGEMSAADQLIQNKMKSGKRAKGIVKAKVCHFDDNLSDNSKKNKKNGNRTQSIIKLVVIEINFICIITNFINKSLTLNL